MRKGIWVLLAFPWVLVGSLALAVASPEPEPEPEREEFKGVPIVSYCAERVLGVMVGMDKETGASCAIVVFDDGTYSEAFCEGKSA